MKRELGTGRCGLACCLCSENDHCAGCRSDDCPDREWCFNRKCSIEKGIDHCFECSEECREGMFSKIKPLGFTMYAARYGEKELLDRLEENEKAGIVYHRDSINGDYDEQLVGYTEPLHYEDVANLMSERVQMVMENFSNAYAICRRRYPEIGDEMLEKVDQTIQQALEDYLKQKRKR